MFEVVNDHIFPFLRTLGGDDSTYAHHTKDRDTKGDLYECMLGNHKELGHG
jgi:type I restriction enzyme M protein